MGMDNSIVREIVSKINYLTVVQFSLIIDLTQDSAGIEQESILLQYVDSDLQPREEFIGLYEMSSTTGQALANMAHDVMIRLNLPLSQLRGQTYDEAFNMAGQRQGLQALLKKEQSLALCCHYGTHC